MIFVYKKWDDFCKKLHENDIHSVAAREVREDTQNYLVLKHDVETDVSRALALASIEQKYGHRGSYYVQAYLLDSPENVQMLTKMQAMGHEISYHYDVMDSCKGDIDKAIAEFDANKKKFEDNGFMLETLCQHGNPIVERVGYTSNRDFFRSQKVQEQYPNLSDIMVNFKAVHGTDYTYYSDAGRQFKMIFDPLTNDIVNSDDQNVIYMDLNAVFSSFGEQNVIISTHPHRWTKSAVIYGVKTAVFKVIKAIAKVLAKLPFMKKLMSKYYYLAKKI